MNTLTTSLPHYAIIDAANLSDKTKHQYKREIDKLIEAHIDPTNRAQLQVYAGLLPRSSKSFLKAALNLLYKDTRTDLKAAARPDNLNEIQARLYNLDAMTETIKVKKQEGTKNHTWLSREQVEQITSLPDRSTPKGMRDYIVLSILVATGLRREELSELTFDALSQTPTKNGYRDVISVQGKGDKWRSIPISGKLAQALRSWRQIVGDGYIARAVSKSGVINGSLSPVGIFQIVSHYGKLIGKELAPHDLRRSYAMLGLNAGAPITQISVLLGHASVATTQKYLNLELDMEHSVSDIIPIA